MTKDKGNSSDLWKYIKCSKICRIETRSSVTIGTSNYELQKLSKPQAR